MSYLRLAFILGMIVTGCCSRDSRLDKHARIVVDSEFTDQEQAEVVAAVRSWQRAVPQFALSVEFEPHEALLTDALEPEFNHIYVIRNVGMHDRCPTTKGEIGDGNAGVEQHERICVDVDFLDTSEHCSLKRVTEHELGHAFGIGHMEPPSVMTVWCGDNSEEPTWQDIEAINKRWGF